MGSMLSQGDKSYSCKYRIGTLALMLPDNELILDYSNIVSIEKIDNYDSFTRSRLRLVLRLDIRQKIWILKYKDEIVCKFELDKSGLNTEGESFITGDEMCWNEDFRIYLNDDDASIDVELLESSIVSSGGGEFNASNIHDNSYFESDNLLEINLFNQELVDNSNKTVNEVFTSGLLQNMVAELLTETDHEILMSPVENSTVYEELLIPKMKVYQALIYLDQSYGLYKTGAMLYYDVDIAYLLNTCEDVTAKREDEWPECTFLVSDFSGTIPGGAMIRKQEEEMYYINVDEQNVVPKKLSATDNETVGSIVNVVTTDTTEVDRIDVDSEVISQPNEVTIYIKKDDNKFFGTILKARMEENESVLYVTLINTDITAFTPNKRYNFIFSDVTRQAAYGSHKYRLAFAYHLINGEAQSYMESFHKLIFKACTSSDD